MTDDNRNTSLNDDDLGPPRFDESASASAQPVQPIPRTRVFEWVRDLGSGLNTIMAKLPLAMVVIGGLAIGTMGGMALVQDRQLTVETPPATESPSELTVSATNTQELNTAAVGAAGWQTTDSITNRTRKAGSRARRNGPPRAYRVAVIR